MDTEKLSFEEAYKQLTELVQKMESGEMPWLILWLLMNKELN